MDRSSSRTLILFTVVWISKSCIANHALKTLQSAKDDLTVRPNNGKPTIVEVGVYVNSIGSISEISMSYDLDVFFRQWWSDYRLAASNQTYPHEYTESSYKIFDKIWVPDSYVVNVKKADFHHVTVPNRLIRIKTNGDVEYSQRISMTLSCFMKLSNYPLDLQTCEMEIMSYGYTTKELIYEWPEKVTAVELPSSLHLPDFNLVSYGVGNCTTKYALGWFSCLKVEFVLKRQIEFYLIQVFVPSLLIVMLSWVNFWIDKSAVPARISVGLLTVLTITTQSSGTNSHLPKVSYIKAIDIWMAVCLLFVFGALIQFAIVNVLDRADQLAIQKKKLKEEKGEGIKERKKNKGESNNDNPNHATASMVEKNEKQSESPLCEAGNLGMAYKVDFYSRIIFPMAFAVFLLAFCVSYVVPYVRG